jgi:hypothetical protein
VSGHVGESFKAGMIKNPWLEGFETNVMGLFSKGTVDGLIPHQGQIQFQFGRAEELMARAIQQIKNPDGTQEVRILVTGRFYPGTKNDGTPMDISKSADYKEFTDRVALGAVFDFSIEFPGFKTRKVRSVVRPGMSTFIDYQMEKSQ